MQDVIRTIARERMDEQSVVRFCIQVKAIVRNGMDEAAIVYEPAALPLPPDTAWLFTWPSAINDGFAGYPNESLFYFNFRG